MSYFRQSYRTFREFQRETFFADGELGKEEIELLRDIEDDDAFMGERPERRARMSRWD
jgi:hypothetical protein